MISPEESDRRRDSIGFFRHSSAIEGITPDEATRRVEDAYIAGDLSFDQFSDALRALSGLPPRDHAALDALMQSFEKGEIGVEEFMHRFATEGASPLTGRFCPSSHADAEAPTGESRNPETPIFG